MELSSKVSTFWFELVVLSELALSIVYLMILSMNKFCFRTVLLSLASWNVYDVNRITSRLSLNIFLKISTQKNVNTFDLGLSGTNGNTTKFSTRFVL